MGKPSKSKSTKKRAKPAKTKRRKVGDDAPAVTEGKWRIRCLDPFGNPVDVDCPPTLRYFRGVEDAPPSWGTP